LFRGFETFTPSFEELFERFCGNFGVAPRPNSEGGLTLDIPLSPHQTLSGGEVSLMIPTRSICPTCGGNGRVGFYECMGCGGQGKLSAEYPVRIGYPPGLRRDYGVQVPLDGLGIRNRYLTVRFRPTGAPRETIP
jgi:DnaJ-class molecular chaperone